MKNRIALLVVIVAFMCLAGCSRHGDWVNPRTLDESVLRISDSCATEPQRQLRVALLDIYFEKIKVVDNRLVLDVEPEYFTTLGISPSYCKMMKLDLKETNECLDRWEREDPIYKTMDLKKTFEDSKAEYFQNKKKQAEQQ